MNVLLSLLISVCMIFSGGYIAEDPAAESSMIATLSNVVVKINDETFPLNPSVKLGASTQGNSALLDVSMPLGEDVLFPVQAKIDETGVSVLLGESSTAYTFSTELLSSLTGGEEIPPEMTEFMDAYMGLISAASRMQSGVSEEQTAAMLALNEEFLSGITPEDATFILDGEEISGKRYALNMHSAEVFELCDKVFAIIGEDFSAAYMNYFNAIFSMSGMEIPEISSFSNLSSMMGMEITVDGEIATDGVRSVSTLNFTFTVDESKMDESLGGNPESGNVVTFSFPMEINVYDEKNCAFAIPVSIEEAGFDMEIVGEVSGLNSAMNMAAMIEDVSMEMCTASEVAEDGTINAHNEILVAGEGVDLLMNIDTAAADKKNTTTQCEFEFSIEGDVFGASFTLETEDAPIADRISAAEKEVYNSEEELENATGLMMAAMGLAGDAEVLMNDESVLALIEAFTAVYETSVITEDGDDYTSDNPSELPFPIPAFGWLPEGYELSDSYVDAEYGTYEAYFESADEGAPSFNVYIYGQNTDATETLILDESGSVSLAAGSVISVERLDDWTYANGAINGYDVHLYYFEDDMTNEEIGLFFSGITASEEIAVEETIEIADESSDILAGSAKG